MTRPHLHGWHRDTPDPRDLRLPRFGSWIKALRCPPMVDLSVGRMPRVEDQGDIGSCTCNAGTSAVEYVALEHRHAVVELSRLFLYYMVRVAVEHQPAGQDGGAQIRDVMKALAKFGVCPEDTWPYKPECLAEPPSIEALSLAKQHRITQYVRCPTLNSIRSSIADGWPVVGGFACPESIQDEATALSGIIALPQPDERIVGNHAVLFVGYDDRSSMLKLENSWGPNWGKGGFGFLGYEYVKRGLADDFWTVRAALGA